jgi:hypothetical protein
MSFACRFAFLAVIALPAAAWNHVGHKSIAELAWDLLTPPARERAGQLLRAHPDFDELAGGAPERDRVRAAFINAAYWPDMIRGDARFYTDTHADAEPTATQPGFPDMKRRTNWHYINVPYSVDGTVPRPTPEPNILTQLRVIIKVISRTPPKLGSVSAEEDPVYLLPWLLHLVGDVHQPLHTATRYHARQLDPQGKPWPDLGGNTIRLKSGSNLHAFWDDALGRTDTPRYREAVVRRLRLANPPGDPHELSPAKWVDEGYEIAKRAVYDGIPAQVFDEKNPLWLPDSYVARMRRVATERAALAALRLANLLNREWR